MMSSCIQVISITASSEFRQQSHFAQLEPGNAKESPFFSSEMHSRRDIFWTRCHYTWQFKYLREYMPIVTICILLTALCLAWYLQGFLRPFQKPLL